LRTTEIDVSETKLGIVGGSEKGKIRGNRKK
jgi:hypothetical protein